MIMHLFRSVVEAKISTGSHVWNVVCIPRINMNIGAYNKTIPIKIFRRHIQVRPAFAININKPQGPTLQTIAIYFPDPVSTHGKIYVALWRIGDPREITLLIAHPSLSNQPSGQPMTLNVFHTRISRQVKASPPNYY